MGKLYFFLTLLLISSVASYSQCAEEVTYVVCDMTTVDEDGDGTPDGIINLYEELSTVTGTTITGADGMFLDPDFNFALDSGGNGDLYLWNLDNSSEFESTYQFQFLDSSSGCPDDIRYLFNIILGPFAGTPTPQSSSSTANITVCEAGLEDFDLFQVFESNPAPHENGVWAFVGNDGDPTNFQFLSQEGRFSATIPYSPNDGSLVDSDVFEFTYTVPGITPCTTEDVSTFRVEVVRDIQSGSPGSEFLCQSEMVAGGVWDRDISLATEYLANEDVEGTWSSGFDPSGQISGPGDDTINLYQAYLDYVTTFGPAIGCLSFTYTYTVEPRINLADCNEKESTITFTISEEIRPFSQAVAYEICEDAESPVSLDLYDQLEFTTEIWNNPSTGMDENVLFDYPNENCTNWELISGPSTLGILNNTGRVPGNSTIDWCSAFINGIGFTTDYRSRGRIGFTGAEPGTYIFRYTVLPSYHCQIVGSCNTDSNCTHPCDIQTADITVIIHPKNYAGEDTAGLEFCESDGPLILTELLDTIAPDTVYVGPDGIWTDLANGTTVSNTYNIPEITTGIQDFNFEYNTLTDEGCTDSATLSFRIYQQFDAGISGPLEICIDGDEVDLFTLLSGSPDANGSWTGPNGYTSATNEALFDPTVDAVGDYIYTVPENGLCSSSQATITVSLGNADYAGEDTTNVEVCENIGSIDLFTLIATNGTDTITQGGEFTDSSGSVIVNPFVFPSDILDEQSFSIVYTTPGDTGCQDQSTLQFVVYAQYTAGTGRTLEICTDEASFNLFDLLTDMPDTNGVWTRPDGSTTSDNVLQFDPSTDTEGNYTYTVPSNVNASGDAICDIDAATISITFFDFFYAGEDTIITFCETIDPATFELVSLLETNGTDTVYEGSQGTWTDRNGSTVSGTFTIPTIDNQETFDFTYSTDNPVTGCTDQATLSFTVYEQKNAGEDASVAYCENEGTVNLYSLLGGTADNNGIWEGPDGYSASGTSAILDLSTAVSGDYIYNIAALGGCDESAATVSLIIYEEVNAGADVDTFVCPGDYDLVLSNLLESGATLGGDFIDLATSQIVPEGIVDVAALGAGTFSYLYIVENGTCPQDDATVVFNITAIPTPTVSDIAPFYCINDGIRLGDLEVNGTDEFVWFAFAEAGEALPLSTLLVDGQVYYLAALDDNDCESDRVPYEASIRPLTDDTCQIDIANGVSDNDDGINDDLSLGSLPDIFPNFDIQVFNRYGTIVYKGNKDTPLFNGKANTGSALGDQLPTGVYFYIFYPNDMNSAPIDGTFYLSR